MNKQYPAIVLLTIILAIIVGCHEQTRENGTPEPPKTIVSKIILPAEVAGTWQARESAWRIVIDPNGTVASAILPLGEVLIKPNATNKIEMKDGNWSTYETGDFNLSYDATTRNLLVVIEVKKLNIAYEDNKLVGKSTDRFVGTVSQDGKTWRADWITVFDYGPLFPQDPNDIYADTVIFEKVPADTKSDN